jgi:SAM-dependent methyltransferase
MANQAFNKQNETKVDFSGTSELFAIEKNLKNYNRDIIKKITQGFLKATWFSSKKTFNSEDILEFGAGIGALAVEYASQNGIKPDCIEIDPVQENFLKERGLVCFNSLADLPKKYDAIYTSNVLEHIEYDTDVIKELFHQLKPGGSLAIYVPAFMCLWSEMDELVGHYRRYSKNELRKKVSAAGFKVLSLYYVDSIGFLAWLYLRIKGYKRNDTTVSDKNLKFFDKILYPMSQFLDLCGCRYLFGKSLLLVAIKPIS